MAGKWNFGSICWNKVQKRHPNVFYREGKSCPFALFVVGQGVDGPAVPVLQASLAVTLVWPVSLSRGYTRKLRQHGKAYLLYIYPLIDKIVCAKIVIFLSMLLENKDLRACPLKNYLKQCLLEGRKTPLCRIKCNCFHHWYSCQKGKTDPST